MPEGNRCGVLLVNTGTPTEPTPRAVRRYLARFLSDPRIVPMNRLGWWFVLHLFILPKRARASAEKYRAIWTAEGSPFDVAHRKLESGLQRTFDDEGLNVMVRCAMSYGEPTVLDGVRALKDAGCERLVVLPLYPQSAHSTTGAVSDGVERALRKARWNVSCDFIDNYHDDPTYIRAIAASIEHAGFQPDADDKVLFSFHSIPLADIEAGDTYELQTGASSLAVAGELGIDRNRWTIGYQCRFDKGREWLSPFTRDVLARWAEAGVGRVFFVCPNFAVDCLETLYDIEHELKPHYFDCLRKAGRTPDVRSFLYVPCLDRSRAHLKVLADVLHPYLKGGSDMGNADAAATGGKTVLLGVTGCIAAYKSCEIVRALQKAGVRVKVVMTEHATEFVGPTTFRALTHEKVAVGLFDDPEDPIHHVSLAQEADAFLIAPCTANVIAKIANGIADDLLTTTALATTAPLIIAPAMNVNMYDNGATRYNIGKLHIRGARIVEAGDGYLACGDVGKGRLADIEDIVSATLDELGVRRDLDGRRVMVTAGPTVEPIDPVRYISNRSSGKTGYAIARAAALRGADVTLVSGPVSLPAPEGVRVVQVRTAHEMLEAAEEAFRDADIAVFAAAVADMRPRAVSDRKLKKGRDGDELGAIELVENPDILATLAACKDRQVVVGFAAETNDVVPNAEAKLAAKRADFVVANQVGEGMAFGTDDNAVWFVDAEEVEELPRMPKSRLADEILDKAMQFLK